MFMVFTTILAFTCAMWLGNEIATNFNNRKRKMDRNFTVSGDLDSYISFTPNQNQVLSLETLQANSYHCWRLHQRHVVEGLSPQHP